ncbi:MAG: hypothetical protein HOZ81_16815 [Streptomyces sp.]|nr:hypothetical protein [Streptomyces sp.]
MEFAGFSATALRPWYFHWQTVVAVMREPPKHHMLSQVPPAMLWPCAWQYALASLSVIVPSEGAAGVSVGNGVVVLGGLVVALWAGVLVGAEVEGFTDAFAGWDVRGRVLWGLALETASARDRLSASAVAVSCSDGVGDGLATTEGVTEGPAGVANACAP